MPSAILYYHYAVDRNTDTCVHIASVSRTDFDEQIRILTGLSKYRPARSTIRNISQLYYHA